MTGPAPSHDAPRTSGRKRRLFLAFGGLFVLAACIAVRVRWGGNPADAAPQPAEAEAPAPAAAAAKQGGAGDAARPNDPTAQMKVVAIVNSEELSREDLARECLSYHGAEVLEALVNKYLIMTECRARGIEVTPQEVNDEIAQMAKQFKIPVDQWLKMLKQERGIGVAQYRSDIIWPMLALRKLAGERLKVTEAELREEFEHRYGESVKVRIIVCSTQPKAEKARAEAAAAPAEFGALAKTVSEDPVSASARGMIPPIRRHGGNPEVEQTVFGMKDGEISPVLRVGNQFFIFQREALVPARDTTLQQVQQQLELAIRDRKQRNVATDVFKELQKKASVENILNDPARSKDRPGVAALINGNEVTLRELAERCIERYGEAVLESMINRRLIEQACRKRKLAVTPDEIDAEIARVAGEKLPLKNDKPDVERWLQLILEQQQTSLETYRRNVVQPDVAIRKLVGSTIKVSDEDLKKGFEANYGPRVRCRAIILDNHRRAQEVWELARRNLNAENFGKLAEKYSIEANTRTMKGEVPPIQRHGGQPNLEKEAFSLKAGELSGIVQVEGDQYVILFCEGRTVPTTVDFDSVKELIATDVREKKTRLAMNDFFRRLQDEATIDNLLAGTTHSPKRIPSKTPAAAVPQGPAATQ